MNERLRTATRFRDDLEQLGLHITREAPQFFDVDVRTVRRWATGEVPVPDTVAMLIALMIETGWPPDEVRKLVKLK